MSTTYITLAKPIAKKQGQNGGFLGLAGVVAGVAVAGAIVAVTMQAPAVELPAMNAAMGHWDVVDARPAVSVLDVHQGYFANADGFPAVAAQDASLGFWDHVDARPALPIGGPRFVLREGAQGYETAPFIEEGAALATGAPPRFAVAETAQGYETIAGPATYGDLATVGEAPEYADGLALVPSTTEAPELVMIRYFETNLT
jgi:hypothetical protein